VGERSPTAIGVAAVRQLIILVPSALLAAGIPARRRRGSALAGFVLPLLLTALAVMAKP